VGGGKKKKEKPINWGKTSYTSRPSWEIVKKKRKKSTATEMWQNPWQNSGGVSSGLAAGKKEQKSFGKRGAPFKSRWNKAEAEREKGEVTKAVPRKTDSPLKGNPKQRSLEPQKREKGQGDEGVFRAGGGETNTGSVAGKKEREINRWGPAEKIKGGGSQLGQKGETETAFAPKEVGGRPTQGTPAGGSQPDRGGEGRLAG